MASKFVTKLRVDLEKSTECKYCIAIISSHSLINLTNARKKELRLKSNINRGLARQINTSSSTKNNMLTDDKRLPKNFHLIKSLLNDA